MKIKYKYMYQTKKTLIFGGGGIKGITYVGVIRALEEYKVLDNIETFVGSSVGVFLIAMYLIGYNSYNMEEFLIHFDLGKLKSVNIFNLLNNFGLDSGEKLEYVLKRLISAKGYDKNITLLELYNITYKKFIITSVCLNSLQICYLSHESYPDIPLYKALMMSMAIPICYSPIIYNNEYYVDGGCMDNYPIGLFEETIDEVLGFYLLNNNSIKNTFTNIESYITRVLNALWEGGHYNCIRGYRKQTVCIILDNVGSFDFNIDNDKIKLIVKKGYSTTINYIL